MKIADSLKILVVDDMVGMRKFLTSRLAELGHHNITTAQNGQEAFDIIQKEKPQLVFLDVMMPKMNGFEVCQKIKMELEMDDVHIILLTAKGQEMDKEQGLSVGANEYMTKPFDPDNILDKAMNILGLE